MFKVIGVVGIVIFTVIMVAIGPLACIWAWNELFGAVHTIPYTLSTWVAVMIIGIFIRSEMVFAKKV